MLFEVPSSRIMTLFDRFFLRSGFEEEQETESPEVLIPMDVDLMAAVALSCTILEGIFPGIAQQERTGLHERYSGLHKFMVCWTKACL
jgi:hypothetical protein